MSMARTSGSSWKSSILTPLRKGACRNPLIRISRGTPSDGIQKCFQSFSVVLAADVGSPAFSMMCAPGSISQMTSICSPRLSSSIDDRVTKCCGAECPFPAGDVCMSATTHCLRRTSTN